MAITHSTSKAVSGRNRLSRLAGTGRKSAKRSEIVVKSRKSAGTQASGPAKADKSAMPIEKGSRIRVPRRLKGMIEGELRNLEKAESLLRCLWFAMELVDMGDEGAPYFPDVAEVAADLIQRSRADLDDLYYGRIPDPLMAVLKVER